MLAFWWFGCGAIVFCQLTTTNADVPSGSEIAALVDNLGHADFAVRDESQKRLVSIGGLARPALEKALRSSDPELRLRAEEILRDLKSTDLWSASFITLQKKDVPLADVLREIERQSGNPFDWKNCKGLDGKRVDIDWKAKLYWQALDDVCQRAGIGQKIEDGLNYRGIVLVPGERIDFPTAYEGPVRLRLTGTNRQPFSDFRGRRGWGERGDSLDLHYEMHWEPRIVLCRYLTRVKLLEATTEGKESLAFRNFSPPPSPMHVTLRQREVTYRSSLRATKLAPTEKLAKLRVETTLVAAGDFSRLEVPIQAGATAKEAGYLLEFSKSELQPRGTHDLTFSWTRPAASDAINSTDLADESFYVLDHDGKTIPYTLRQVVGDRTAVQYCVTVEKVVPAKVSFRFARLRSSRRFEFTMTKVPLTSLE